MSERAERLAALRDAEYRLAECLAGIDGDRILARRLMDMLRPGQEDMLELDWQQATEAVSRAAERVREARALRARIRHLKEELGVK